MNDNNKNEKKSKNSETIKALVQFSHIGVTVAASIFVGVLLGKYIDELLGTSPWMLLICSLLGVGAAFKFLLDIPN